MLSQTKEKMKTTIGGQALIEGIMMRGPEKDAIVVRKDGELNIEVKQRKLPAKGSVKTWPFIRGAVNFFDAQVAGVKALILFFLLPMIIGSFFDQWLDNALLQNLLEGGVRILIFVGYMLAVSQMPDMKRVFAYHGAEHKTIRCYEAGLPLTVENVRVQTRLHPRCGTSFLLVVMILSILVFSLASSLLLAIVPSLAQMQGTALYRFVMIVCKLAFLPLVVSVAYEINRLVGRYDNWLTRIMTAPGMWFQNFTTNEPDDSMIEVGIASLEAVLPEQEGADRW